MSEAVKIGYTGTALPLAAATVSIFDTVVAFQGGQELAMFHMKRLLIDIFNDQAGTLNWFKSRGKRGTLTTNTTWVKVGTAAVPIVAAGATNSFDLAIPEYEEFKVELLVGGVNTAVFDVDLALSDEINKET